MTPDDLVLVGHPFSAIGMAEHVRSAWRAFRAAGATPGLIDIYGLDRHKDPDFEREFAGLESPAGGPLLADTPTGSRTEVSL